ncbi:MAG: MATE family efflux transporter [Candidatus Rokubacteria bacterium]|nr:MATE family efflux transporter [Candidatus Rokubacteria bacterium]
MDVYVQETLIRQEIAEAQQRAARNHLLRHAPPQRTQRSVWALVSRLFRRQAQPARGRSAPPTATPRPGAARTRLLLDGPIVSTLLRLGAPNVVVNVLLIAVTASVDAHFVGQLGSSALAGLALVFPLIMLMQQMANGSAGAAIASAIARAIGAGRRDDATALVVHAVVVAVGMATIFTTVALTAGPTFYRLMGGSGPTLVAAVEYSNVVFAGAVAYWVLGALTNVVRGAGQAAVLATVYVAAEILHVLLVPALVFGLGPIPALGITGAGLATVISFAVSSLVLAVYVVSGRTVIVPSFRTVRLSRRLFVEILRVGAPMSLQPILRNLTLAVLTGFVGTLGPTALAAFGAAVRLEYVQIPLAFGLGAGVLAMVGTNLGAGRSRRAERITWTATALAVGVTGATGIVALAWPGLWVGLFSGSPAVQTLAADYLRIVAVTYPFLGLGFMMSSAFQAAGRPLWPLVATCIHVVVVAAGGSIVVHATDSGVAGLAVVNAAGLIAYGVTLAIVFRARLARAWRAREVLAPEPERKIA